MAREAFQKHPCYDGWDFTSVTAVGACTIKAQCAAGVMWVATARIPCVSSALERTIGPSEHRYQCYDTCCSTTEPPSTAWALNTKWGKVPTWNKHWLLVHGSIDLDATHKSGGCIILCDSDYLEMFRPHDTGRDLSTNTAEYCRARMVSML